MTWAKIHWKALTVTLVLLLGAAWYSRPVDIYTAAPGIREPDTMEFILYELGENHKDYSPKSISPEDPEWDAALKVVESLRFRRPPWNAVLQFIPKRTITGRSTHDGDLHFMLYLGRQGKGHIQIQFFIDEWMYYSPHCSRNLTLWVEDSRKAGEALAEVFRPLLEEL